LWSEADEVRGFRYNRLRKNDLVELAGGVHVSGLDLRCCPTEYRIIGDLGFQRWIWLPLCRCIVKKFHSAFTCA